MYRTAFKNRAFLLFYIGVVCSDLGDVIAGIGFLFAVYQTTRSSVLTTGVAIAETLPYILFGLIGGAVSDFLPRRKLMLVLDFSRGFLQLGAFILFNLGHLPYFLILAIIFCIQSAGCFFNPSQRALLPQLVPTDQLTTTNALVNISTNSMSILSPLVVAILLTYGGIGSFFAFDAVTYFISTISLWLLTPYLKEGSVPQPQAEASLPREEEARITRMKRQVQTIPRRIWDFARFTSTHTQLRALFITTFLVVFFHTWAWQVGLLLKAETTLPNANGEQFYTFLLAIYAVISIATNLLIPWRWKRLSLAHYLVGATIWGLGIFALGWVHSQILLFLCVAIIGLGLPFGSQSRVYLLQTEVPKEMYGQGFSFAAILLYFSNLTSLSLFGWLSAHFSSNILLMTGGGGIMLVAGCVALLVRPQLFPSKKPATSSDAPLAET